MADLDVTCDAAVQQSGLQSGGVRLRPLCIDDAAFVAREGGRPEVARMCALVPSPNPALAAEGFILAMRAAERGRGDRVRLVESETGEPLGLVGLHPAGEGAVEFGYWYARSAWGRGVATQAGRLMLETASRHGVETVQAGHFEDNPASGRVLEKLGFVYTGETVMAFSLGRLERAPCRRMVLHRIAGL